ncbi:hypothetical protein M3P19_16290 [Muricauda sp. 2012CJ35-5]|uniref:peptidylprolyl isomerase n=1 Tax=Flagellimonas spongiicola TaxID=2942208 RepID=A0ABT0PX92_9FLAO|nr:hypothetical protein [Allomuricauda spongiicola]MCL6275576.1 hypothetical protein [Allomuricauda spongiicola]
MKHGVFVYLFAVLLIVSCSNDDDNDIISIPPRSLSEVAAENDEEIREFLQTHFYNYEEFMAPPAGFDFRIKIDTIAGDNATKTPMLDFVEEKSVTVSASEFLLDQDEVDIPHKFYVLDARTGVGENPTVADSVFVRYEGTLLSGSSFDSALNNPVWFDLARLQDLTQGFRGFAEGVPSFKTGETPPIDNGDGTVTVNDYGVGMIIFPSGLGNFNRIQGDIPQYSPLIFSIDLYTYNPTDHDGDGIPSIQEDFNMNGYLYDDNADADTEPITVSFANFQDADDDGDGVTTRDEITNDQGEIIFPYPDDNNDGIPNYLDPDVN